MSGETRGHIPSIADAMMRSIIPVHVHAIICAVHNGKCFDMKYCQEHKVYYNQYCHLCNNIRSIDDEWGDDNSICRQWIAWRQAYRNSRLSLFHCLHNGRPLCGVKIPDQPLTATPLVNPGRHCSNCRECLAKEEIPWGE